MGLSWEEAGEDVAARREVLTSQVETITVRPGKRGGRTLDADRVTIEWVELPEEEVA